MDDAVSVFKALSDPTRLRLVVMLFERGETCVCVLAQGLGMPQCSVSRHLAVLRAAGMVRARRQGTWMYYRMLDPGTPVQNELWKCLRTCFRDDPMVCRDRDRVKRLSCRKADGRRR